MAKILTAAVLAALFVARPGAQTPAIVSSVKPSAAPEEGIGGANFLRGGRFRMTNTPLTAVLLSAYGTPETRIIGGPDWIRQDRWDVDITVEAVDGTPPLRTADVLQAMLRDRFKLDAVLETRERPIYALRIARSDGQLGPNLVRSAFECLADFEQQKRLIDSGVKGAHGERPCSMRSQRDVISFAGQPITNLLSFIPADRVVQDRTGLIGPVDLTLTWTNSGDPVSDQASMYSAIRDQLGLRLESATAPLDVLVIKSVSRPTPN